MTEEDESGECNSLQEDYLVDPSREDLPAASLALYGFGGVSHLPDPASRLASLSIQLGTVPLLNIPGSLSESLKKSLERAESSLSLLKEDYKAHEELSRQQRREYMREIQMAREKKNEAEAQRAKYYNDWKTVRDLHETEKKETHVLRARVELLEGEKEEMRGKLELFEKKIFPLEEKLKTLELLREDAEKQSHELGDSIPPLKDHIERLLRENSLLKEKFEDLSKLQDGTSSALDDAMTRLRTSQSPLLSSPPPTPLLPSPEQTASFQKTLSEYEQLKKDVEALLKILPNSHPVTLSYQIDPSSLERNMEDLKKEKRLETHQERARFSRLVLDTVVAQIYSTVSSSSS